MTSTTPVLPPLGEAPPVSAPTLVSAVPSADAVALSWIAPADDDPVALFASPSGLPLGDGDPLDVEVTGEGALVVGFTAGETWRFSLGREQESGTELLGATLTVRFGNPVYIDVAAPPGGDGLTPDTAYSNIFLGLIDSLTLGGANLWLAGGEYPPGVLPLFPGTAIFGGFPADFDLAARDPDVHPTRIPGLAGNPVLGATGPGPVVLDGLIIDGRGAARACVESLDAPLSVRACVLIDASGPGLRLRMTEDQDPVPVLVTGCLIAAHTAEGLSGQGALDLSCFASRIESNVQEGIDLDDLTVSTGRTARVMICDTRTAGNGAEGIDIDLAAPSGSGAGRFEVTLRGCRSESNGAAGVLVDVDYDTASGGVAMIVVDGQIALANDGDGMQVDLDAPSHAVVTGFMAGGNEGDGFRITSETSPTLALVSDSACVGNLGAGLRAAEGRGLMVVSNALTAGNLGPGLASAPTSAGVASSLAWLQPDPWPGATTSHVLVADDPDDPVLGRLPVAYTTVAAWDADDPSRVVGVGALTGAGPVELSDDDVARSVTAQDGDDVVFLDPAPELVVPGALVTRFPGGEGVTEDYRALPGGPADGTGLGQPGELPVDIGPRSSPGRPVSSTTPFAPAAISPPTDVPIASAAEIRVSFGDGTPDPRSVTPATVVARDAAASELLSTAFLDGDVLVVVPPAGGWPAGAMTLVLHPGLASLDGRSLPASYLLPFEVAP